MGRRRRFKLKKKDIYMEMAEKYRGTAEPVCKYFGECGGCMFQDVSYENQLQMKKDFLQMRFGDIYQVEDVKPSPILYGYRNRMDFVTAFGLRGLRKRKDFKTVVDIEECPLMQDSMNSIWKKVRENIKDIPDYNYIDHEGYLRYIVLRQGYFSKELMCNFVISKSENKVAGVIDKIQNDADSISLLLSDGLADLSYGPIYETSKNGYIHENFENIKYKIGPNTFFQSNSSVALMMYNRIKEEVEGSVLELYSGVGTISLFVSDVVEKITGVEIVQDSVDAAKKNAEINGIDKIDFVCSDARPFMRENENCFDTLLVDPPREGIHPKMIKYIEKMAPKKIVYMSCNPSTFVENFKMMENYQIEKFESYDMFPQTPHVESLAVLRRI